MTITNGQVANADDVEKIIVSSLQSINQNTILSQDASVTDKSYTYASSDTFSDSNGYNNTIDTGNTDALFETEHYEASTLEFQDELNDNSVNGSLWTTSLSGSGTNTVTEANSEYQQILQDTEAASTYNHTTTSTSNGITMGIGDRVVIAMLSMEAYCSDYLSGNRRPIGTARISVGGGMVRELIRDSGTDGAGTSTITDEIYEIVKTGASTADVYIDGVFSHEISGMSGDEVSFYANAKNGGYSAGSPRARGQIRIDYVRQFSYDDAVVQTNSKTFSSNVKSILVNANKVLNGSSTITIDVSSDGGSTWDVTSQALDSVLELDGDDTDIVVKFNLNVDSGDTPELYGYSYQVWT
jgi:hypothetical protein